MKYAYMYNRDKETRRVEKMTTEIETRLHDVASEWREMDEGRRKGLWRFPMCTVEYIGRVGEVLRPYRITNPERGHYDLVPKTEEHSIEIFGRLEGGSDPIADCWTDDDGFDICALCESGVISGKITVYPPGGEGRVIDTIPFQYHYCVPGDRDIGGPWDIISGCGGAFPADGDEHLWSKIFEYIWPDDCDPVGVEWSDGPVTGVDDAAMILRDLENALDAYAEMKEAERDYRRYGR